MNSLDNQDLLASLKEENNRLKVAVEELSVLNDIAIAITSTNSVENIINLIVRKCVKHLQVEQCVVQLLDEKDEENPFHTMIRTHDTKISSLPYRLDAQLTGWMLRNKRALLTNDISTDDRFKFLKEPDMPVKSLLSVPLTLKGKMIGLITVFNKKTETGFTSGDQRMLSIITAQSAQVLENARLHEEEQTLRLMQEEMRLASEIQRNLLPKSAPKITGYEIAGLGFPAKEVGGDYFDFIQIEDNLTAFCLGDISGKGIPAAMLMSNLQATLRSQIDLRISCKESVSRSNKLLYKSTDSQKFATLFYGILNSVRHELCYCSAGHDSPFLFSEAEKPLRLQTGGLILGFMPDSVYEDETIKLRPGDLLVIYSDGITEAMNHDEEEFGEKKLETILSEIRHQPVDQIIAKLFDEIESHVKDNPPTDDRTLIVIKRVK